ncbi:galactarate dehydratase [Pseudescherichia vulneris]|nr:galactarate dehydratase [Pseudescherichia vulneris]
MDIPAHGNIVRYGEVIGYAVRDIARGSWIDESTVELPTAPPLNTLPLATKVPAPLPALEGYTFEGYRNADGSVGTKNLLGITTSVHCVAGVVDYVVKIIERDLLPKYPNVDGVGWPESPLRLRRGDQRPGGGSAYSHYPQHRPEPELWWRSDGGWPGL